MGGFFFGWLYVWPRTTEFTWTEDSFEKFQNAIFFQDIKKSFHGVTQMGPKPHQNFFWKNISTNMVARGVRSFGILEGATGTLIE